MMRVFNFGAGPATLPEALLTQAQSEGLDWQGLGMSVMEVSHRSPNFIALLEETESLMRTLLKIPNDYDVLFIGSPARFHFGCIALNFLKTKADYVVSGAWSKMAAEEAAKIGAVSIAASNEDSDYLKVPETYRFDETADYCYFTPNETLSGLSLSVLKNRPLSVPLIADMTSCILSEPLTITDYAMIIAGAQKNLAPSGLSVVIIKHSFLMQTLKNPLPSFFDYKVHAKHQSNYATPPTFNIYMANLMLKWVQSQGGVEALNLINKEKAALLYDCIDACDFYHSPIVTTDRSIMNVTFRLADETLNEDFLAQAQKKGLVALKGHRSIGGMRASIYNAMPLEGIKQLVVFMNNYKRKVTLP